MKKVISVSLALIIAFSLVIVALPAAALAAGHNHIGGINFHVRAEGQGQYTLNHHTTGSGEFSIIFNGNGDWYKYRGWAIAGGGGRVRGSFDGHELDLVLQVKRAQYGEFGTPAPHQKYPNLPLFVWFDVQGTFDGMKIIKTRYMPHYVGGSWGDLGYGIMPDGTNMDLRLGLKAKNGQFNYLVISMDSSMGIFKLDVSLVGW